LGTLGKAKHNERTTLSNVQKEEIGASRTLVGDTCIQCAYV